MWVLTTFFAMTSLVILWLCAAYFVVLRFVGIVRKRPSPVEPETLPRLSVVVPCFNEARLIEQKLENLLQCDYPSYRVEFIFVDGGSHDGTLELLKTNAPSQRRIRIYESPAKGKINQLNHVLPKLTGEIVVITDADGMMERDTLRKFAAEFAVEDVPWVVGAYSRPSQSIWRDRCFWDSQNRGRLIESDAHGSSIVIATCYAFRRELLRQFPEDVVADDVFIGFLAHSQSKRVVYSRAARVTEVRGPGGIAEFLSHKFRKNNAFLRESLRFIYRLPDMNGLSKLMMLTRTAQQLLLPWCVGVWSLLALTLLTLGRIDILVMAAATLLLSLLVARQAFQSIDVPPGVKERFGLHKYGVVFLETICVLFAAALSYPYFRQNSSYARISNRNVGAGESHDHLVRIVSPPDSLHLSSPRLVDRMGLPVSIRAAADAVGEAVIMPIGA
ncbi:MAG: glycosyltransferase [Planctomycetes bacterium]|nr:glycosyltransferase [Planctomycetota bacterium]